MNTQRILGDIYSLIHLFLHLINTRSLHCMQIMVSSSLCGASKSQVDGLCLKGSVIRSCLRTLKEACEVYEH